VIFCVIHFLIERFNLKSLDCLVLKPHLLVLITGLLPFNNIQPPINLLLATSGVLRPVRLVAPIQETTGLCRYLHSRPQHFFYDWLILCSYSIQGGRYTPKSQSTQRNKLSCWLGHKDIINLPSRSVLLQEATRNSNWGLVQLRHSACTTIDSTTYPLLRSATTSSRQFSLTVHQTVHKETSSYHTRLDIHAVV
jgi:hypothetical protein